MGLGQPVEKTIAQSRADAVAALRGFVLKYRNDQQVPTLQEYLRNLERETAEAAYAQAVFYDRNRHDRAAAIAAYRDFQRRYPDAPQAREAAARLKILERGVLPAPQQGAPHENVR